MGSHYLRKFTGIIFRALAWSLTFCNPVWAQLTVEEVPPEYEKPVANWVSQKEVNESPFYKKRLSDGVYAERLLKGQVSDIADDLVAKFAERDWGEFAAEQEKITRSLSGFLAALKEANITPGIIDAIDTVTEQSIFLSALNKGDFGLHTLQIERIGDSMGYFANTASQLKLFEFVEVNGNEEIQLVSPPDLIRQWRLLEDTLTHLLQKQVALVETANIQVLESEVRRWENFLDNGYSQMPWESAINGRIFKPVGFPNPGPPGKQLIFLHPTLGLEFNASPLTESRVKEVMHIELLGYIRIGALICLTTAAFL